MAAEQPIATAAKGKVPARETTREEECYLSPAADIYETRDGLTVVVDLPGVEKDAASVSVNEGILTIKGAAKQTTPGNPIFTEFKLMNYFRQFQLTEEVDINKISADLKCGVLTIDLPRAEKAKPKKIPISVD